MTRANLTGRAVSFSENQSERTSPSCREEAAKSGGLAAAAAVVGLPFKVLRRLPLAALLVDLAQLPFQFRDQFLDARPGHIVARLPRQRAVLHDLHFEFHPFVLVGHPAWQRSARRTKARSQRVTSCLARSIAARSSSQGRAWHSLKCPSCPIG